MLFHTANNNKRNWLSLCKDCLISPRTKCSKQPQVLLNYYRARTLDRKMSSLCLPGPTSHDSESLSDLCENSTPWSSDSKIPWSAHSLPQCVNKHTPNEWSSQKLKHISSAPASRCLWGLFVLVFLFRALHEKRSHIYYSVKRIQMFHRTIRAEM